MKHFHGQSSLKTWIYRIAVHEASNRRRWWYRHKARETTMEPPLSDLNPGVSALEDALIDPADSPFVNVVHDEIRSHDEEEVRNVSEAYCNTVNLRDLEEMSYEEIEEITEVSLGTVEDRL